MRKAARSSVAPPAAQAATLLRGQAFYAGRTGGTRIAKGML